MHEIEANIKIHLGECGLKDFNSLLVLSSVEQFHSIDVMCLGTYLRSPSCVDKWSCFF